MKEVIMPKFGFTQEFSEIVEWRVKEGDSVEAGDILAEVTTDKISMEVESPEGGIVAGVRYKAGETVPVTEIIAYILKPGESIPAGKTAGVNHLSKTVAEPMVESPVGDSRQVKLTPLAARMAADRGLNPLSLVGSGLGGRVTRRDVEQVNIQVPGDGKIPATPAAKRAARETGISLERVRGTGPSGRIQEVDVRKASTFEPVSMPAVAETSALARPVGHRTIPFTGMRKAIAMNMALSAQTIPAIQLEVDMDMEKSLAFWEQAKLRAGDTKVSLTALIVKSVAWALARHPILNSQLSQDEIIILPEVNIGLAVAIESGLIVPVIHEADHKGILQLARELNDVTERAHQGKLRGSDLEGATFTISNLGMFGIDRFTAIINPPQVGILAVSAVKKQFKANESGEPVFHSMTNMRLSTDHRVVDGVAAARFLSDLRKGLESPEEMLL